MKKVFCSLFILFTVIACGSKDEKFCKCMESGKQFNEIAKKMLEKGGDAKIKEEFLRLKKQKEADCKPYETMAGPEMLKKKQECEE